MERREYATHPLANAPQSVYVHWRTTRRGGRSLLDRTKEGSDGCGEWRNLPVGWNRVADAERAERMEAVVAVARRFRDAMRRYMAEQTEMIDRGVSLDDLVRSNWSRFAEAAAAEEELFALLDTFDANEPR